ncbi:TMV resistance protein N-like [Prosopis cineraria]|uniref:TMV resistance protein N-like n=1 Tax=Prosopis cineraria TaxID=364024 RepID=UPI00240FE37D|nr:TMV resistance protein N-like [Prosopis cineraria]
MEYAVGGKSSTSSSTSDSTPEWKYDVFLSFAGKDTCLKFTGHLDDAFIKSGINTLRDDVDFERGGAIKDDLFQAIEDSLCSVLVISENYANSTWCLEELQKILESKKKLGRRVFPIFYDVDPADVRKQQNSFGKALAEHEDKFGKDAEKVQNWKNVLFEIGKLAGWDTRSKYILTQLAKREDLRFGRCRKMAQILTWAYFTVNT